ncbi:putative receptor-like protein kinase [Dorcoceras hygrometricum]|uniref:Putative receptor-like protein kinase n=1 Tax=Dorcoceras hygrometricum TaxID=472368 RepID=A0A2Z7D4Q3_9LAMI|nr:putative receptor-like protein kinase [Dorcoceras hygrometricum]
MRPWGTAAADAQRSSPPVGTYTAGSSPASFKPRQTSLKLRGPDGSRQTSWPYDICEKLDLTDISTSWLVTSWEWSKARASNKLEERERTEQAQLQTKRGEDAEVAPEDQLEDGNKEAGEKKKRASKQMKEQPA